ncbi:hypothetical protein AMAG_07631 [Allomyces macrogynus ATCC 38327]|uniref:Uncharacterized protein n=1 Tax=Allomyces macrogynus (strain ATCC 38327) TaxID=578462 RepID=A0A0L0SIY9_ALLM3|nr:hypothetical protein AMAG_07631 [Allomyces macrogynus ATCC 38327]|eukprot:KNE62409.1 hypothetical protein AMAG_07631 [Allomyces macrogynus ATCC 38327]
MPNSPHIDEPDRTPTATRRRRPSPVPLPASATESAHLAGDTTPSWSSTWSDVDTDGLDAMSGSTSPSLGVLSSAGFTSPALSGLENDSRATSPIADGPPSPLWMATHLDPTVPIDHVDEGDGYESDGNAFARMHASWSRDIGLRALEPAPAEAAASHVTHEPTSTSADANRDNESIKDCASTTTSNKSENGILPMVVAAGLATLAAADVTGAAHSVANSLPHEGGEHEYRSNAPDSPSTTSLVLAWGVSKVASMVARVLAIDDPMLAPEPAHADEKLADVVSSTRAAAAHAAAASASRNRNTRAPVTNTADDDSTPIPLELPTTLPRSASHASLLSFAAKYADLDDPPAPMEPPAPIRRRPRYPAPRSDRLPRAPSREVAGSDNTSGGVLVSTLAALWRSVLPAVPAAVEATSANGGERRNDDEEDENEMVDDAAPPLFARGHHMDGLDTLGARLGFGISVPDLSAAFPKLTVF